MTGIPTTRPAAHGRGRALIVDNDVYASSELENLLITMGFKVCVLQRGKQAIEKLGQKSIDFVFMKTRLADMHGSEFIERIKESQSELDISVVFLSPESEDELLKDCMNQGLDNYLLYKVSPIAREACINSLEQMGELNNLYKSSVHEQVIGKQILSAALSARNINLEGMRTFSRSAEIFSGDLVLSARKPDGSLHILLADFTGHGLSAAIGVLPVADMFSVMTEKGFDPEKILKSINKKLYTLLPTRMFMAACIVQIDSKIRNVIVWNSGMPDVYLLEGESGGIKQCIKSSHIPLGINVEISNKLAYEAFNIDFGDQIIMHTDGLTDVLDTSGAMFGVSRLVHLMEESDRDTAVFDEIVHAFDHFSANQHLCDDVTLVSITCDESLMATIPVNVDMNINVTGKFRKEERVRNIEMIADGNLKSGFKL